MNSFSVALAVAVIGNAVIRKTISKPTCCCSLSPFGCEMGSTRAKASTRRYRWNIYFALNEDAVKNPGSVRRLKATSQF